MQNLPVRRHGEALDVLREKLRDEARFTYCDAMVSRRLWHRYVLLDSEGDDFARPYHTSDISSELPLLVGEHLSTKVAVASCISSFFSSSSKCFVIVVSMLAIMTICKCEEPGKTT